MRIAFVVDVFPALSETFILNQITGLIDRGHSVDVYARCPMLDGPVHEDFYRYNLRNQTFYVPYASAKPLRRIARGLWLIACNGYKDPGVVVRALNPFKHGRKAVNLHLLFNAIPLLGQGPYDIVQCHYAFCGIRAATMKRIGALQGKVVTMFHGFDIRWGLREGAEVYRPLIEGGDCFLAISPWNREHLVRFGFDGSRILDHPVGIDVQSFALRRISTDRIDHSQPQRLTILSVARLVPEKALHYGIKAVAQIIQQHPDRQITYRIVGEGCCRTELEDLIESSGLSGIVTLLGARNGTEVRQELQAADIFLLPSVAEVLPVALMEAHATGLPVVASAIASVGSIVRNGVSGYLVRAGDVQAMADRLSFLIDHPVERKEMGRAGRAHVEANYDIEKLNDRLVEIYEELLNG